MNILWEESQGRMKIHDTGMYSVITECIIFSHKSAMLEDVYGC